MVNESIASFLVVNCKVRSKPSITSIRPAGRLSPSKLSISRVEDASFVVYVVTSPFVTVVVSSFAKNPAIMSFVKILFMLRLPCASNASSTLNPSSIPNTPLMVSLNFATSTSKTFMTSPMRTLRSQLLPMFLVRAVTTSAIDFPFTILSLKMKL